MVADRLDIQGIPALPVNVVHGIDGWLFNFDMSPIYCPQTLGHSMALLESGNKLLYLGHRRWQPEVLWTKVVSYGLASLSEDN